MALTDKLKKQLDGYLKDMTRDEMVLALRALKQEQKRRKGKKKKK